MSYAELFALLPLGVLSLTQFMFDSLRVKFIITTIGAILLAHQILCLIIFIFEQN